MCAKKPAFLVNERCKNGPVKSSPSHSSIINSQSFQETKLKIYKNYGRRKRKYAPAFFIGDFNAAKCNLWLFKTKQNY